MLETLERTALTLNLPLDLKTIPLIDALRAKLRAMQPIKANTVQTGPVFENIERGDEVDLMKFPVPRWHAGDGGRYLGTAHLVVTRDPETGIENVGCYRVMLQDKDKVGLYISPGKHGKIHYEKAMKAGKPFPVAMAFGQHPLLYIAASQAVPYAVNEYDWAGGSDRPAYRCHRGAGDRTCIFQPARNSSSRVKSFPANRCRKVLSANGPVITPAPGGPNRSFTSKLFTIATIQSSAARRRSSRRFTACIVPACAPRPFGTAWSKPVCRTSKASTCRRRLSDL